MLVDLRNTIKSKRPNISEVSLKNYTRNVYNLYEKILNKKATSVNDIYTLFFTRDGMNRVMDYLQGINYNVRKTIIAGILSLCDKENDKYDDFCSKYRLMMYKDINQHNIEQKNQEKSDSQKENWLSYDEIVKVYKEIEGKVNGLKLFQKQYLNKKEYELLQSYVVLSMYILIPPRRIKDYVDFVVDKDDTKNYLVKQTLVFNSYKTKDTYAQQKIKIGQKLTNIIKKWVNKKKELRLDTKYVFSKYNKEPFTQPDFTNLLFKIFKEYTGRNVSVNLIRHAFISDKVLHDVPALNKLEETAEKMAHSVNQQMLYKKQ